MARHAWVTVDEDIKGMTDAELRTAIEACDIDCLEYEDLMKDTETRDRDV